MNRNLSLSFLVIGVCLIARCGESKVHKPNIVEAATEDQFRNAVSNAAPGTVIEVADGDYAFDDGPLYIHLEGTKELPILLRAKNRGKARFTGEYAMLLEKCSYVTVEGFTFHNRALKHAVPDVLGSDTLLGSNRDEAPKWGSLVLLNCNNSRLTRLTVQMEEKSGNTPERLEKRLPRVHWINLTGGEHNRVDHCRLKGKFTVGVMLVTGIGEQYFSIDHNHFAGRPLGNANGFETIRLGTGDLTPLYGIIEYNLFENCDGEGEIISVKSSIARISRNTFLDCSGMLVIRHANRITVDYNFFINTSGKEGVGGVRIHGNDNNVLNNYFGGLTGPGIYTYWGDYDVPDFIHESPGIFDFDLGAREYSYRRTCRAHIAYNTWADCKGFLNLGKLVKRDAADMNLPPKDWSFHNNLIVCTDSQFIRGEGETGFRWSGNIFWNPESACIIGRELPEASVRIADPKLVKSEDGLWRLPKDSPAVDSARKTMWYWLHWVDSTDMDGQARDLDTSEERPYEFNTDVGADEYSGAPVTVRPLTAADVGVNAR